MYTSFPSPLNHNFFIFGIIKYSHMPSSELHDNCILLGELSPHLRDACLHYHVLFFSQSYSTCFELNPSESCSSLWVPILRTGNKVSWIKEHKFLVQRATFKAKLDFGTTEVLLLQLSIKGSVYQGCFHKSFRIIWGKKFPNLRDKCTGCYWFRRCNNRTNTHGTVMAWMYFSVFRK